MEDIFELATINMPKLTERYSMLEEKDSEKTKKIKELINVNLCLSINMKYRAILGLLFVGKLLNAYELKESKKNELKDKGINVKLSEGVKAIVGNYYEKREEFNNSFYDSKKFRYAALNIGGLGTKYGNFCAIINRDQIEKYAQTIFVKQDSLSYVEDELDFDSFQKDLSIIDGVHMLAMTKHDEDIFDCGLDEIPSMICHDDVYIESIIVDDILIEHISCLRLSQADMDIYDEFIRRDFFNDLEEMEQYQLEVFLTIQRNLESKGIDLVII